MIQTHVESGMTPDYRLATIVFLVGVSLIGSWGLRGRAQDDPTPCADHAPLVSERPVAGVTLARGEATSRARLLHESIRGSLLLMHRDFFDDEDHRILPSQSLKDLFKELQESHGVECRWLTVDADEMNVEHRPANDAERRAVERLKGRQDAYEEMVDGALLYVGRIPLANQCLKCHLKGRTRLDEKSSGLIIIQRLDR